jgi:signal transduction histidine kinase
VLQSLALVHKRGRELSEQTPTVPAEEVRRLADVAAQQERVLRSLILQEIDAAPTGTASLRRTLEAEAARTEGIPVTVNAVGPVWLEADRVDEVAAAVRQALDNVVQHAEASRAAVFLDDEDDWVTIAVRDNGRGFDYDEGRFRDAGKVGMIRSMRGRIEGLGGRMRMDTAPGLGTEVEFRIPANAKGSDDEGSHPGGRGGRPSALAQSRAR